jgi:hypothetical protein
MVQWYPGEVSNLSGIRTLPFGNHLDQLDEAEGVTLNSRLGCQAKVYGDVEVEIPPSGQAWGREDRILAVVLRPYSREGTEDGSDVAG